MNIAAQMGKIGAPALVAGPQVSWLAKTEKLYRIARLALPGFEASLRLVDDVDAALAAHEAIIAVSAAQRFQ